METIDTIKNSTSAVKGATGVTIAHRTTSDSEGVRDVFATVRRESTSLGYINYGRGGNRCQIFFEPFNATTTKEKKAIVAAALADLDELLTPQNNG